MALWRQQEGRNSSLKWVATADEALRFRVLRFWGRQQNQHRLGVLGPDWLPSGWAWLVIYLLTGTTPS